MVSTVASSVAQLLAQHTDDDVLQALQLFDSLRPHIRQHIVEFGEPLKRYEGHLGHVNPQKGFGFITSSEATQDFGKDVFVSTNESGQFRNGDLVTFTVITNKNGQPQARLVQGSDGSIPLFTDTLVPAQPQQQPQQQAAPPPVPPPLRPEPPPPAVKRPRVAPPPAPQHTPRVAPPPAPQYPSQKHAPQQHSDDRASSRLVGTITSFNEQTHFGFISSQRAMQMYGKDVFLSSMEIGSYNVGDAVTFEVALNKNGQPQARNLQAAAPTPPQPSRAPATAGLLPEVDKRYVGTIQTFSPEKHFGFIQCPDTFQQFSKDVFVSDQELAGYVVGDSVSFQVVLNSRGHPQARNLGPPDATEDVHFASGGTHERNGYLS